MVQAMFTHLCVHYVKRNGVWKCRESKEIFLVLLVKPRPPAKSPLARARASAQYPHPTGAQPERQPAPRVERGAEISAQNRPQVLVHSPVHLIYSSWYCSRSPRIKSLVVLSELPNTQTHTLSLSLSLSLSVCLSAVLPLKLCSI